MQDFLRAHRAGYTGFNILSNPMQVITGQPQVPHVPQPQVSTSIPSSLPPPSLGTSPSLPGSISTGVGGGSIPAKPSPTDLNMGNVMDILVSIWCYTT